MQLSYRLQLSETQLSHSDSKVGLVQVKHNITAITPLKEICDEKDSYRCNRTTRRSNSEYSFS
ncbi:hypothetical protein VCR4J2_250533 [Vibrio coralliirubri]|nr:hypothetical protein VCR4J2_250533 [Vibrio coralliirubri]